MARPWASFSCASCTAQNCPGTGGQSKFPDAHSTPLSAQEVLENLKDRWYQADNPPSDLLLTEDEFLSFLHPEHSRGMLKFMVKEIVRDLGEACPVGPTLLPTTGSGAPPGGDSMGQSLAGEGKPDLAGYHLPLPASQLVLEQLLSKLR